MSILQYENMMLLMDMGIFLILELYVKSLKEGHNITQMMSFVHMPNNIFTNKNTKCRSPSVSDQIRSQGD